MEFSFDRTKNEQSGADSDNQSSSSSIASDRLRKAIERNRAKQATREAHLGNQTSNPEARFSQNNGPFKNQSETQFGSKVSEAEVEVETPKFTPPPLPNQIQREKILRERELQQERFNQTKNDSNKILNQSMSDEIEVEVEENERPYAKVVTPEVTSHVLNTSLVTTTPKTASSATRRSVAKPEDTEFVPTAKRSTRKVASQVNYSTNSKKKNAPTTNESKFANLGIKFCWAICVIAILRLIFADGGIVDYYSQKNVVKNRVNELESIKKDNSTLLKEIERMRNDKGYQRKLVRDNLGFIAQDEYLVLFPKEK